MGFVNDLFSMPLIFIGWIIVGGMAGVLARRFHKSQDTSFSIDFLLGIIGAIVGGFVAGFLGVGPTSVSYGLTLILINLVLAALGATLFIAVRRAAV
jgi:uncharacterized membrane protein YeaQ/YmgE (transglycosylase-associated protein family)